MSPIMRKMLWVTMGKVMTQVERAIERTVDRDQRNVLVFRLARLDRRLAEVRDAWGMPELPVCEGR